MTDKITGKQEYVLTESDWRYCLPPEEQGCRKELGANGEQETRILDLDDENFFENVLDWLFEVVPEHEGEDMTKREDFSVYGSGILLRGTEFTIMNKNKEGDAVTWDVTRKEQYDEWFGIDEEEEEE